MRVSHPEPYECEVDLPSQRWARSVGKGGSLFIAVALTTRLLLPVPGMLLLACAVSTALFLGMVVAPIALGAIERWRGSGTEWETTLLWKAQSFAFGVSALMMLAAAIAPESLVAQVVLAMVTVLMALATFTEFCLGRVAYVLLVRLATVAAR